MTTDHPLDELIEEMLPAATELSVCVRDRDAEAVHAVLGPVLDAGDRAEIAALCVALAALVPDDVPMRDLLAWTHQTQLPLGQLHLADGEKWCGSCQQALPVREFQTDRSRKDGLKYWCRVCCNERERERYHRTISQQETVRLEGEREGCHQGKRARLEAPSRGEGAA